MKMQCYIILVLENEIECYVWVNFDQNEMQYEGSFKKDQSSMLCLCRF